MDLFDGRFPKPYCEGFAWVWLEAHADEKGVVSTSFRALGHEWGWTHMKARRQLERWVAQGLCVTRSAKTVTHISLKKTSPNVASLLQAPAKSVTPETDLLGEPVKRSRRKPRSALTEAWKFPAEWGEWAISEGMSREEARVAAREFRLFWISNGEMKADWKATWQKRVYALLDKKALTPAGGEDAMLAAFAAKLGEQ